jgi:hypothetical protein
MENELNTEVELCETETNNKGEKQVKRVDAGKVLEYFTSSLDISNNYTLDEYKKIITSAYKDAMKKTIKANKKNRANKDNLENDVKKCDIVKREPTKYNIFVKETILHLKTQNPDKPYKELMKMAADKWNENKIK